MKAAFACPLPPGEGRAQRGVRARRRLHERASDPAARPHPALSRGERGSGGERSGTVRDDAIRCGCREMKAAFAYPLPPGEGRAQRGVRGRRRLHERASDPAARPHPALSRGERGSGGERSGTVRDDAIRCGCREMKAAFAYPLPPGEGRAQRGVRGRRRLHERASDPAARPHPALSRGERGSGGERSGTVRDDAIRCGCREMKAALAYPLPPGEGRAQRGVRARRRLHERVSDPAARPHPALSGGERENSGLR